MAKIGASKESLEGFPPIPDGLYEFRLDGFDVKPAKNGNSLNLNPEMKIINHPTLAGQSPFENLNSGAGWIIEAFSHALGAPLDLRPDGGGDLQGDFTPNGNSYNYSGPLVGMTGKFFIKMVEYQGKSNPKVDQYICQLPGCTKKHPTGLAK